MMRRLSSVLALFSLAGVAHAEVPSVVTDIPPVQSLVAAVMGDLGTPEVLAGGGADAHSYQLRPSQARALANAGLVFWVGHEMTPWLERALEAGSSGEVVALLGSGGSKVREFSAAEMAAEHADAEHSNGGADHDHGSTDPHGWLDPDNARAWLGVIRDGLAKADPEHADVYAANAAAADASIAATDAEIKAALVGAAGAKIVMGHDAYGYFADHFGLTIAATVEAGDAAEPGAAHLEELRQMLKSEAVRCMFPEAGGDPERYVWLAEGTGTKVGTPLDPEGRMLAEGPGLYEQLLTDIGTAVADCLAGT